MTQRMRLYAFHCGTERSDRAVFDPFDERVGEKILSPYFLYLVSHPRGWVLIDTGLNPALRADPHAYLGAMADSFFVERLTEDDHVVSKLAMLGLEPGDVMHVVQSHLHFDHAGGLQWFPHATIYVQGSELPFAYWPPVYQRGLYVKADFDHPLQWKELVGEYDMFEDGRIVLFPTPGHTPGHQSVLVRLDSGNVIIMADAHYVVEKMRERLLPSVVWNPDAMVASWERIEALERRHGAELLSTHDPRFASRVRLAPEARYE
jgi:glyoxylase-like metal-dependent hydrolase (beta-lactamase superfamily II)